MISGAAAATTNFDFFSPNVHSGACHCRRRRHAWIAKKEVLTDWQGRNAGYTAVARPQNSVTRSQKWDICWPLFRHGDTETRSFTLNHVGEHPASPTQENLRPRDFSIRAGRTLRFSALALLFTVPVRLAGGQCTFFSASGQDPANKSLAATSPPMRDDTLRQLLSAAGALVGPRRYRATTPPPPRSSVPQWRPANYRHRTR